MTDTYEKLSDLRVSFFNMETELKILREKLDELKKEIQPEAKPEPDFPAEGLLCKVWDGTEKPERELYRRSAGGGLFYTGIGRVSANSGLMSTLYTVNTSSWANHEILPGQWIDYDGTNAPEDGTDFLVRYKGSTKGWLRKKYDDATASLDDLRYNGEVQFLVVPE